MKRLYRLRPSTRILDDFYVIDVETAWRKHPLKDSEHFKGKLHWQLKATPDSFVFACIYGLNYTKVLYSVDAVKAELLLPRYKNRKVFAHNGGNYDYPCIYGNVFLTDPKAIFNGKFISFTNGNCTFADSVNIFVGAKVSQLGEMLGLEKKGMSRNYTYSNWPGDKARDVNGCIRDCEIVWEALWNVFEFTGEIKITQAALSMSYFRRNHLPFDIEYNENVRFFWDSYYGGRTEAFKLGNTHASVIDVNSMYPFMMKSITFPNPKFLKYERHFTGTDPTETYRKYARFFEGVCHCTVYHAPSRFGYLPYKQDGKLIFPNGIFRGVWNFNELSYAVLSGIVTIKKLHYILYGERMPSPFVSFVDYLQQMKFTAKLTGNKLEEDRAKRFSNSLYGKFAQRIDQEHIYIEDMRKQWNEIREAQRSGSFVKIQTMNANRNDCWLVLGCQAKTPSYAIPSFASYVTSAARVELLKKMLAFEHRRVVYCDTDSIFFELMDDSVKSSNELGGWKIEDKIVTKIYGLKNYRYTTPEKAGEQRRLKGVPNSSDREVRIFDGEQRTVKFVEEISPTEFRYFNLIKTKEAIKRGLEPGVLTERIKRIKNTYDKRLVLANGETKPIEL